MIHSIKLPKPCNFLTATQSEEISQALLPIQEQCLELTKPLYFGWEDGK
jgi:hypothetical protein